MKGSKSHLASARDGDRATVQNSAEHCIEAASFPSAPFPSARQVFRSLSVHPAFLIPLGSLPRALKQRGRRFLSLRSDNVPCSYGIRRSGAGSAWGRPSAPSDVYRFGLQERRLHRNGELAAQYRCCAVLQQAYSSLLPTRRNPSRYPRSRTPNPRRPCVCGGEHSHISCGECEHCRAGWNNGCPNIRLLGVQTVEKGARVFSGRTASSATGPLSRCSRQASGV